MPTTAAVDKLAPLLSYLGSLTDQRAEVQRLAEVLGQLEGVSADDLRDYVVFDEHDYRRNLVIEGPMYEVLLLCWRSGHRSPVHDHARSVCGVKVLQGKLTEVRYRETPCGQVVAKDTREMEAGQLCASVDRDIHEISNLEGPGEDLVTLHIYSPPLRKMTMYDPAKPGTQTYQPVNFEFHGGSGI